MFRAEISNKSYKPTKSYFREDILSNCNKYRRKSKLKVVACLSEIIVRDAMNQAAASNDIDIKTSQSVSSACQAEVKFQLLQKHSSIELNPLVVSNSTDIDNFS